MRTKTPLKDIVDKNGITFRRQVQKIGNISYITHNRKYYRVGYVYDRTDREGNQVSVYKIMEPINITNLRAKQKNPPSTSYEIVSCGDKWIATEKVFCNIDLNYISSTSAYGTTPDEALKNAQMKINITKRN